MKAAIYVRVSTDEQAKHGFSLEAQQESCMSYIKSFNHELFKVYIDDGYSAKNMNRPALQDMLDDIRNKRIEIIVLWRLDRLTRKARDGLEMVDEIFNKYGVSFATITERHDLTTAQGRWMFTVSLANAQNERELIGERVTFGQEKKAQKGFRVSLGAIYGYDKVNGKLEPNENESPIVHRIFEYYVFKGWGYGRIAAALNSESIPAKKTSWQPVTIKGILKNITYIGKNSWTPRNGQAVINDGEHVGIITEELFLLAQTQLKRRCSGEMSRSSYNYPFSTIIKCGACGGSYNAYNKVRRRSDAKAYTNYRCANRKAGICKASDIAELKLEKLFFDYFDKEEIYGTNYIPEPTPDEIRSFEKEKSRITREVNKLDKRKNNLLDDLGDRVITREEYKESVEKINQNLSKLREEMNILEPQEVAVTHSPDEIIDFVRRLKTDWEHMNNQDRKFVVQSFFKRIVIKKEMTWSILEVDPT
jgi:site-specific DNA recombinase